MVFKVVIEFYELEVRGSYISICDSNFEIIILYKFKDLGKEIGRASGMKMIYASATKGTFALHAAVLTAAHKLGLSSEYFDELKYSKPDILLFSKQNYLRNYKIHQC